MPKFLLNITYVLIILIGLVAMYTLLNAGAPDGLWRPLFPDPNHDIYIALVSSVLVFILGFIIFYTRDQGSYRQIIELNAEKVRALRQEGIDDDKIADSILAAMGITGGYRHYLAHKKLVIYLSEFK